MVGWKFGDVLKLKEGVKRVRPYTSEDDEARVMVISARRVVHLTKVSYSDQGNLDTVSGEEHWEPDDD